MKKQFFNLAICLILATCGGGGNSEDGLGGNDPFDFVPNETPIAELLGDWLLLLEITESKCPDLEPGEEDETKVRVTEDECVVYSDPSMNNNGECKTGGSAIGVSESFSETVEDECEWTVEHSIFVELSSDNASLTGSFEGISSLLSDCSDELIEEFAEVNGCIYSGNVTGTKSWDPSTGEDPPSFPTRDDFDGDSIEDSADNCVYSYNPDQADSDGDGVGDFCESETDSDEDGIIDDEDNCPYRYNPSQTDIDRDGIGNDCDEDRDGDGISNFSDNCSYDENYDQTDLDDDGTGDICDFDRDGDYLINEDDNCPETNNGDQADADGDGTGDVCDSDRDGDRTVNEDDNCPEASNADQADSDRDGVGNICDNCFIYNPDQAHEYGSFWGDECVDYLRCYDSCDGFCVMGHCYNMPDWNFSDWF